MGGAIYQAVLISVSNQFLDIPFADHTKVSPGAFWYPFLYIQPGADRPMGEPQPLLVALL